MAMTNKTMEIIVMTNKTATNMIQPTMPHPKMTHPITTSKFWDDCYILIIF